MIFGYSQRRSGYVVPSLEKDPRFRCFGCCHVRTGALCLGTYYLMLQLVCAFILLVTIMCPSRVIGEITVIENDKPDFHSEFIDMNRRLQSDDGIKLTIMEGDDDNSVGPAMLPREPIRQERFRMEDIQKEAHKRMLQGDVHMALALLTGLMCITMLLIYGILNSRPVYMLPFFCYQVFDFVIGCLTALGHYSWLPQVQSMIMHNPDNHLSRASAQWLAMLLLLACVVALGIKGYLIGVVWSCYQYLNAKNAHAEFSRFNAMHNRAHDAAGTDDEEIASLLAQFAAANRDPHYFVTHPTGEMKPPDYDEASKMPPTYQPSEDTPPPSYTA